MEDASLKVCPFCKEKIRKEAVKCRFCGEWLEQGEQYVSPAPPKEATPPKLPEPIEASPLPKTESAPIATPKAKKEISVKTLYWISGVLLAICGLIWFVCLAQVPWQRLNPGEATEKIVGGFLKMFIGVALVTWGVKRKGYKLLTFSIACAVCTAIFTYYFLDSRHKAQQKVAASNKQLVENITRLQQFVQQGADGNFPDFKPTGDADIDTFFRAMMDFYAKYFEGWRDMNAKLVALQEKAVSDDEVLTNKFYLSSEIGKRIAGQKVIGEFASNAISMMANFKRECLTLQVGEDSRKGALRSLEKMSPQFEAMFAAWIKSQQTEQMLLQFLADNFQDYELKGGAISFANAANRQKYAELAKTVQDTSAEVEDFQKRGMATMEASKR